MALQVYQGIVIIKARFEEIVGILEIVYVENKYQDTDGVKASLKMLNLAGVKIRHYTGRLPEIEFVPENEYKRIR